MNTELRDEIMSNHIRVVVIKKARGFQQAVGSDKPGFIVPFSFSPSSQATISFQFF